VLYEPPSRALMPSRPTDRAVRIPIERRER
jgi:hypothetical protein